MLLDNHSAHICRETRDYLGSVPLRGIRAATKQEPIDRIRRCFEEVNADPVVFRWKYKMDEIYIV